MLLTIFIVRIPVLRLGGILPVWSRTAASFEINPISISSILVEFGTLDCGIAFPEYVITKFPAKLHPLFFHFFRHLNVPHAKLAF